jgi:hypothetical protein
MNSAWDHFEGAVQLLVRSGPIKDRLAAAYRDHLSDITEDDVPREVREEFRAIGSMLTRVRPLPGEDAVRATLRKMSPQEADGVALAVVRVFAALPRTSAPPLRHAPSAQVVPLYLADALAR